jgi:TonB family protein
MPHADILDQRDSLRGPFAGSIALHVGIIAFLVGFNWWVNRGRVQFGSPDAMGGSVGIQAVDTLPFPEQRGEKNPLANDTESKVPTPPKVEKAKPAPKEEPEPDAVPLKSKRRPRKESEIIARSQKFRPQPDRPNQVYSAAGQAVSSPLYGGMPGVGGVGIGPNSVFGTQFGGYATALVQQISRRWAIETAQLPAIVQRARPLIIRFELMRDGTVRGLPAVLDSSGNPDVDRAAQRSILNAAPFPHLPPDYTRNSATVELTFKLER